MLGQGREQERIWPLVHYCVGQIRAGMGALELKSHHRIIPSCGGGWTLISLHESLVTLPVKGRCALPCNLESMVLIGQGQVSELLVLSAVGG